jgi:phosphoribosyl 1,2-cyclic phosphate phosphodiesterase
MEILLLGTGAADGIPGYFLDDRVSRHAREHGCKDVRSRCAAIIDGEVKIDLGPDTMMQLRNEDLSARDWSALFFTHSDDDHLSVADLQYALVPFTREFFMPFTIYGNKSVAEIIHERYPDWPIEVVQTESYACYQHGPYRIVTIRATHIPGEDCHNLIIERGGKQILYASDTGWWSEETWAYLKQFQLDALVIECTDGFAGSPYDGHLDVESCIAAVERLRKEGVLRKDSRVVTTHHSSRGDATHAELERALYQHGIEVGYDGMRIAV